MSIQVFEVDGMTCGHCVAAVTEELAAIAGTGRVEVVLGSPSVVTVTDGPELSAAEVAAALDEAGGYTLVPSR